MCSGAKTPFDEAALVFLGKSPNRIGPVNSKALYVEYSDASFKKQVVRPTCLVAHKQNFGNACLNLCVSCICYLTSRKSEHVVCHCRSDLRQSSTWASWVRLSGRRSETPSSAHPAHQHLLHLCADPRSVSSHLPAVADITTVGSTCSWSKPAALPQHTAHNSELLVA